MHIIKTISTLFLWALSQARYSKLVPVVLPCKINSLLIGCIDHKT